MKWELFFQRLYFWGRGNGRWMAEHWRTKTTLIHYITGFSTWQRNLSHDLLQSNVLCIIFHLLQRLRSTAFLFHAFKMIHLETSHHLGLFFWDVLRSTFVFCATLFGNKTICGPSSILILSSPTLAPTPALSFRCSLTSAQWTGGLLLADGLLQAGDDAVLVPKALPVGSTQGLHLPAMLNAVPL